MVNAEAPAATEADKPLIAATMFGVTTPCVTKAREILEAAGYEVLVFHATGTGGQAMEDLVRGRFPRGRARRNDDRTRLTNLSAAFSARARIGWKPREKRDYRKSSRPAR